jgi:hypothetical protein
MRDCIRKEPKSGIQFDLELFLKDVTVFTADNSNECKLLSIRSRISIITW